MFFRQSDIQQTKTIKKTAGMLVTESQSGGAPKPTFSIKTNNKLENSGNQGQINHRNWSLFLSLIVDWEVASRPQN